MAVELAKQPRRRSATKMERMTPCLCCGHFLSHRHHLLPFAEYGENTVTIQLCANCHEIYHLLEKAHGILRGKRGLEFNALIDHPKQKSLQLYVGLIKHLDHKICNFFGKLIDGVENLKVYIEDDGSILEEYRNDFNDCIQDLNDILNAWISDRERREASKCQ